MATLTLQVENPSLLEQLKAVLRMMRGVTVLDGTSEAPSLEADEPNATTVAAMQEAEGGVDAGVVCTDSVEAFMASME